MNSPDGAVTGLWQDLLVNTTVWCAKRKTIVSPTFLFMGKNPLSRLVHPKCWLLIREVSLSLSLIYNNNNGCFLAASAFASVNLKLLTKLSSGDYSKSWFSANFQQRQNVYDDKWMLPFTVRQSILPHEQWWEEQHNLFHYILYSNTI